MSKDTPKTDAREVRWFRRFTDANESLHLLILTCEMAPVGGTDVRVYSLARDGHSEKTLHQIIKTDKPAKKLHSGALNQMTKWAFANLGLRVHDREWLNKRPKALVQKKPEAPRPPSDDAVLKAFEAITEVAETRYLLIYQIPGGDVIALQNGYFRSNDLKGVSP